eukprot:3817-Heterococcus_DN1.PRE.1
MRGLETAQRKNVKLLRTNIVLRTSVMPPIILSVLVNTFVIYSLQTVLCNARKADSDPPSAAEPPAAPPLLPPAPNALRPDDL